MLSEFFDRDEFRCRCGQCDFSRQPVVDAELLFILDDVRRHFGSPVTVNSSQRCKPHNSAVGGSVFSQHLYGRAADIVVKDVSPDDVHKYIDETHENVGLGKYKSFTHIDVRGHRARWEITG